MPIHASYAELSVTQDRSRPELTTLRKPQMPASRLSAYFSIASDNRTNTTTNTNTTNTTNTDNDYFCFPLKASGWKPV